MKRRSGCFAGVEQLGGRQYFLGHFANLAALGANPFKRPVLMLRTAALLTFSTPGVPAFHGRGLGGAAHPLSTALPATVHQGYAPLLPLTGGDLA